MWDLGIGKFCVDIGMRDIVERFGLGILVWDVIRCLGGDVIWADGCWSLGRREVGSLGLGFFGCVFDWSYEVESVGRIRRGLGERFGYSMFGGVIVKGVVSYLVGGKLGCLLFRKVC